MVGLAGGAGHDWFMSSPGACVRREMGGALGE